MRVVFFNQGKLQIKRLQENEVQQCIFSGGNQLIKEKLYLRILE